MLRNYLATTLRHFRKNYRYATLNVLGLALGFAACLLIAVYVHYETSYESFHTQADRIYRTTYRFQPEGEFGVHWARVPVDYVNELPNDLPEVETLVRFQNHEQKYLRIGNEKFRPEHAYVTDPEVFAVFDFPLLQGDAKTALERPRSVVLTPTAARRYFGTDDVLGREVLVTGGLATEELAYTVTGVMAEVPSHTHLPVEMLLSYRNPEERSGWAYVYTLLREGTDAAEVTAKLPAFIDKYTNAQNALGVSFALQALPDIHLDSNLAREIVPNGNRFYVRVFSAVGGFILLIALLNYVNLSSALALGRTREVGVRTVLGASQWQLVTHAGVEAVVYNLVAMVIGCLLAYAAFPYFHALTGVEFLVSPVAFAGVLLLVTLGCGLLAGGYPAWMLVSVRTLEAIKSNAAFALARRTGGFSVKRVLVTMQFATSMLLIASALVAYDQFRFLHQKNLGMTTEQILALPNLPNAVTERYEAFRTRVAGLAGVQQVAACMEVPSREIRDSGPVRVEGVSDDPRTAPMMDMQVIDSSFVSLMNLELLAGEGLSYSLSDKDPSAESYDVTNRPRSYLINETAMRQLGWSTPQEAIGQQISWTIDGFQLATGPITGVVKDFHQETLRNAVDPTVMTYEPIWLRTFLLNLETRNISATVAEVQRVWDELFPAYPMEYHFLDDLYERLYTRERVQLQLLSVFSGLAILVALLGLFSLTAYTLRTRVREMTIRRVLGANVGALIRLVGREYMGVLLVGGLLALPLSYWAVSRWLQDFAYRVEVSVGWYVLTLGAVSVLLLLVVGWQTRLSTSDNPAEVLQGE